MVELDLSNITTESVNNEVIKFIQRYVYGGKKLEGIAKTRMAQYNEIKENNISHFILSSQFNSVYETSKYSNLLLGAPYD